ncbi:hypothetical protein [Actinotignum urinale]|uniref:Uncharacterized protein n=1 Tax=Actinotignum urinale TaxID=190146 RepID=A0ABU5G7V6_9ACTO|nr:hypothetical protein [Actinotignum urinale]MDY5132792.1 hypothetical protein [Actinotignum urinale]MDY5159797.1 hypothetical protein [Actinotignum urinale]
MALRLAFLKPSAPQHRDGKTRARTLIRNVPQHQRPRGTRATLLTKPALNAGAGNGPRLRVKKESVQA